MHFQQKAQKVKFIVIYILFSNNSNKKMLVEIYQLVFNIPCHSSSFLIFN